MTGDGTTAGRWWRKAWPGGARPDGPPAADMAGSRDDEARKQSMTDLSRQLGERVARQSAVGPAAAAAARRAALQEYENLHERRLIAAAGVAVAAIIGAGTIYLASTTGSPPAAPSATAGARTEPVSPLVVATAAPAPAPPPAVQPVLAPAVEPAADNQPAASATGSQASVEPPPSEAPLRPDEVREVQARLRSFGFNAGPVDGNAGRMTEGAVMRYQQDREQPQTGEIDRRLLEQLRQDPAPQVVQQVAQRAARPSPRATGATGARRSDPFEPVRTAGDRFGRWLDSLTR